MKYSDYLLPLITFCYYEYFTPFKIKSKVNFLISNLYKILKNMLEKQFPAKSRE